MDPFTIATAAASIGGSLLSGNAQAKAAKKAAALQQQATNQAVSLQRNANDQANAIYRPYVAEGDEARRRYNALLGLPSQSTQTPVEDYAGYRARWEPTTRNNPTSPFHRMVAGLDPSSPDYDKQWSRAYRDFGGPEIGFADAAPQAAPTQSDIDAARADVDAGFDASPQAAAGRYGAERATNAIMGNAGANSRVLSGRTLNAVQQNETGYRANALLSYMDQLGGVSQTGFNAGTGIAQAGQTFANNAGNLVTQGAANTGAGYVNAAAAQGEGMSNGLTLAAWLAGQRGGAKPTGSTKTGSFYAQPPVTMAQGPTGSANALLPRVRGI